MSLIAFCDCADVAFKRCPNALRCLGLYLGWGRTVWLESMKRPNIIKCEGAAIAGY